MKLSIIIPAYNAQSYIERCISSLLNQSLSTQEYEIIVINDGSTDHTAAIVLALSQKSNIVKLISQENKMAGGARNTGLKKAQGEYILFVDADDYVMAGSVHRLLDLAKEGDLDILMADYCDEKMGQKPIKNVQYQLNTKDIITGKQFLKNNEVSWTVWSYLFKKEFLEQQQLLFRENSMATDVDFSLKCVYYANRMQYVNIFFYSWLYNPISLSHGSWNDKKIADAFLGLLAVKSFTQLIKNADADIDAVFERHMGATCFGFVKNSSALGFSQTKKACRIIQCEFLNEGIPVQYNLNFQLIKMLIKLSPTVAAIFIFPTASIFRYIRRR